FVEKSAMTNGRRSLSALRMASRLRELPAAIVVLHQLSATLSAGQHGAVCPFPASLRLRLGRTIGVASPHKRAVTSVRQGLLRNAGRQTPPGTIFGGASIMTLRLFWPRWTPCS